MGDCCGEVRMIALNAADIEKANQTYFKSLANTRVSACMMLVS